MLKALLSFLTGCAVAVISVGENDFAKCDVGGGKGSSNASSM